MRKKGEGKGQQNGIFAICQLKQGIVTALKHLAFTIKSMENLKPVPQNPHSTIYQQVRKAFTVE